MNVTQAFFGSQIHQKTKQNITGIQNVSPPPPKKKSYKLKAEQGNYSQL